ncbi:hypothetical protein BH20VER3_BH20VER3_02840 [soil metagenome]
MGCLLAFLGACALPRHEKASQIAPGAEKNRIVGEVVIVDEEKQFVLIDLEANLYVPAPGVVLRTVNSAGETGQLKASPERKRPFIAADIVAGNPAVGDQVVR